MEAKTNGWIIVNDNHPANPNKGMMLPETFRFTRKECISGFVANSGANWRFWYRKFNFRAKKAEMIIKVSD